MWKKSPLSTVQGVIGALNVKNQKNMDFLLGLARKLLVYSLVATDFGSNENEASC